MNQNNNIDTTLLGSRGRIKILKTLFNQGEINITRIVKMTGLNHKNVEKHLETLVSLGLVKEKKIGRIRLYSIDYTNPQIPLLAEILEKTSE